uniref:Secreted protein n=1 Tax=Dunaliella tertiolecta TaxID=3047 RepID=A0A6S8KQB5_DUNTE
MRAISQVAICQSKWICLCLACFLVQSRYAFASPASLYKVDMPLPRLLPCTDVAVPLHSRGWQLRRHPQRSSTLSSARAVASGASTSGGLSSADEGPPPAHSVSKWTSHRRCVYYQQAGNDEQLQLPGL